MKFNERGISPVVGTILLVAVTVIIAGSIAAFVYGLSGTGNEPITPRLKGKGIESGTNQFTISHRGGEPIPNAVSGGSWGSNLKLTIDGNDDVIDTVELTGGNPDFDVGEEITITLKNNLETDNFIQLIYTPANSIPWEEEVD